MKISKKQLEYIIPMLVTFVLFSVVLCVKHIFPFGKNTIDYYDMSQQTIPLYYHIYDMLHGKTAFFYNFYTALGTNMSMVTSGCSGLSLFNLFFLLVPRKYLLESISIFHMLKLLGMTFTMFFYLDKRFRVPYFFKAFFSVNYAFSGFVLMLYMENKWMDIAILFPLIMYFYDRMMHGSRITGYVVTLSLALIESFYLGAMILIFIFLYTGLKLLADKLYPASDKKPEEAGSPKRFGVAGSPKQAESGGNPKQSETAESPKRSEGIDLLLSRPRHKNVKKRRAFLLELGFSTVIAIMISSFILIPQLVQIFDSARFANGSAFGDTFLDKYKGILEQTEPAYTTRWWTLLNISFASAVIFVGLIRVWKNRKLRFITIGLIVIVASELFIESINLLWHFGSYIHYPIRNGFMINFSFALLASMYAERLFKEDEEPGFERISLAGLLVSVILFAVFAGLYSRHPGMQLRSLFHVTAAMMLLSFVGYVGLLFWRNGAHYSLSLMILCTELLCYGFLMYGKPAYVTGYLEEKEQSNEFIKICRQLRENFDLSEGFLYRIKNPDESLNANYGFVLERSSLSNWTHLVPDTLLKSSSEWGYSVQFTRLLDAGGTVFTDALIGVRDVISCLPQDEELYEKAGSAEIVVNSQTGETMEYGYYKCRYTLPFGVPVYSNAMFDSELENRNPVSLENQMYRSLTGADTDYEQEISAFIARNGQSTDDSTEVSSAPITPAVKRYLINTSVSGKKALYFCSQTYDAEDMNMTIAVSSKDGAQAVLVPSIQEPYNISYPAHFNNNVIYLGTFEDEAVSITVDVDIEKGADYPVNVFELDLNKLRLLCDSYKGYPDEHISAGKKTISFSADVSEAAGSSVMLLPIAYDDGWSLKVNGKKSDILYSYSGMFTAVPLYSGLNRYELSFFPSGMGIGIVISLLGLAGFAAIIIIRRQKIDMIEKEIVVLSRGSEKWLVPFYMALWTAAVLLMYAVPVVAALICRLKT